MSRDRFDEMAHGFLLCAEVGQQKAWEKTIAHALRTLAREERRAGWKAGYEDGQIMMRNRAVNEVGIVELGENRRLPSDDPVHLGIEHMAINARIAIGSLVPTDDAPEEPTDE